MNRAELRKRLSLGEVQNLEFKIGVDPSAIGQQVCAFLNSGGGYVVLGVNDGGEIKGVSPASKSILSFLEQTITTGLTPKALVSFEEQIMEGRSVWVIEVPAGHDIPYSYRNEIFIREGEQTRRADVATLRDMILRRQNEPERWERRFSDADLEQDMDEGEIRAMTQSGAAGRLEGLFDSILSPLKVLMQMGLVKYGRLTNGGDVLFASHPATRHPQVRVRAVCYTSDKTDDTYRDFKTFEGPLMQVLEQAYAFIQRNTPSRSHFRSSKLVREEQSLYPPEAIREGLVNAFAHRDYADFRGGIVINIYPNRLEIWNSGDFPKGITAESLAKGHISILRNPDIAHALYLRGMMEKLGRGSVMIRKACKAYKLPMPVWSADAQGVTLTYPAPEVDTEVTPEVTPEVDTEATPEVDTEATPEVKKVIAALVGTMARRELQEKLGLKDAESFRKRYLLPALKSGLVEMTMPDKPNSSLQAYRLAAAGRALQKRSKA